MDDSTNEEGMIMYFFDEEDIQEIFASFHNITIGINKFSADSITTYNSDYLITITK
ncbi:hypothetical protein D3C85_1885690 [compost metagenome]